MTERMTSSEGKGSEERSEVRCRRQQKGKRVDRKICTAIKG